MDVVMNNCKSSLKQINKETEILNQLIQLNRAERLYSDFNSLYEMALAIYPHRCSEYSAFAEKLVSELSVLSSIRAQATIKVIVNGDKQNRIKGKICFLLSQNGITVAETNARYVLSADVFWNESQFNGIYSCIPQIQITVSNNKRLAFFAAKCDRELIKKGCEMMGLEVKQVAEICIEAMKKYADELGLGVKEA